MMNEENEHIETKIERYLKGEMPEMERVLFQAEIWLDAALYEKVILKKSAREVMLKVGLDDIRQMMQKDLKPQYKNTVWRNWWLGGISAIVLLGTASYFYRYMTNDDKLIDNKKVFSTITVPVAKSIEKEKTVNHETSTKTASKQMSVVKETMVETKENKVTPAPMNGAVAKVENGLAQNPTNKASEQTQYASKKEEKSDLCADFKPNFNWKTVPALAEEANGKIVMSTNDKNLSFTLEGHELVTNSTFENLAQGTYRLLVSDGNGCKADGGNITIAKTFCKAQVQDVFHLQIDEKYLLSPYPEEATEAWVYDKTMLQVAKFDLRLNTSWDGKNQNAQPVPAGLYKVEVHYKNGDKCFHNVTVFE